MRDESTAGEQIGREKYQRLIAAAQNQTKIKVAVAHPCDDVSLRGAVEAFKLGLIEPILVALPERLAGVAGEASLACPSWLQLRNRASVARRRRPLPGRPY
jgi:phosphate acetyltransferase